MFPEPYSEHREWLITSVALLALFVVILVAFHVCIAEGGNCFLSGTY